MVLSHSLCRESCNFYDGQLWELFPSSFSMLCLQFLPGFVVSGFLANQFLLLPEAGAAPACYQKSDGCALFINPLLRSAFSKTNGLRSHSSFFETSHTVLRSSAISYS